MFDIMESMCFLNIGFGSGLRQSYLMAAMNGVRKGVIYHRTYPGRMKKEEKDTIKRGPYMDRMIMIKDVQSKSQMNQSVDFLLYIVNYEYLPVLSIQRNGRLKSNQSALCSDFSSNIMYYLETK